MTDGFTFFKSYYDAVEHLDAETKAEYFDVLFRYALREELPESPSPVVFALFSLIKPNVDTSKAKRLAGQAGGKQKSSKKQAEHKQKEADCKQPSTDKDKDKEEDKEIEVDIEKEEKKGNIVAFSSDSSPMIIASYLLENIKSFKPNFKEPNLKTWASDIDKAIRIDNRSHMELIGCIDWIYSTPKGEFWTANILSGKKLREKFDTMEGQMMQSREYKSAKISQEWTPTDPFTGEPYA